MKRTTVKEIKKWFKTLEENRYKRTYNSDARRVAWFVNNSMSENYDTMPESMRKKWVKAEYKKERYMAKKFLESIKQNESVEDKVRQVIRETIRDLMGRKLTESIDSQVKGFFKHTLLPAFSEDFTFGDKKNADRALKLLKKLVSQLKVNDFYISEGKLTEGKIVRWEIPMKDKKKVEMIVKKLRLKDTKDYSIYGSGKTFEMELDSKYEDKVLELLMKMNIKVRG